MTHITIVPSDLGFESSFCDENDYLEGNLKVECAGSILTSREVYIREIGLNRASWAEVREELT